MQMMMVHHAQAIEMVALVDEGANSDAVRLMAERIAAGQADEMALMRRWLEARGAEVPDVAGEHAEHVMAAHADMPGMVAPERMAALAQARGVAFDRMFLESMIHHHEGALVMVAELFAAGGGQEAELYQFASHVDADQRSEIARMQSVLSQLPE